MADAPPGPAPAPDAAVRAIHIRGRARVDCRFHHDAKRASVDYLRDYLLALPYGAKVHWANVTQALVGTYVYDVRIQLVGADQDGDIRCAPNERPVLAGDPMTDIAWDVER